MAVNVDAVKRVRDLLREDLLDVENVLKRLMVDPILLCDVIYCVCKPQADAEQVCRTSTSPAPWPATRSPRPRRRWWRNSWNFSPTRETGKTSPLAVRKFNIMADRARESDQDAAGQPDPDAGRSRRPCRPLAARLRTRRNRRSRPRTTDAARVVLDGRGPAAEPVEPDGRGPGHALQQPP